MSPADLQAIREICGMSQGYVAEALGVSEEEVKLWEGGSRAVPEEVIEWANDQLDKHEAYVDKTVEYFVTFHEDAIRQHGEDEIDDTVMLSYYRSQEEYDEYGRDPGYYGIVNARVRAIGELLRDLSFSVEYKYPK